MRRVILLGIVLFLPFIASCSKQLPATYTRQVGEACNQQDNCKDGLFCENGICRIICKIDTDCNKGQHCEGDRCVNNQGQGQQDHTDVDNTDQDNTDIDNTDQDTDSAPQVTLPSGGAITNVAGYAKTSDGKYAVKVLGGSVSGGSKGENSKVIVNEGSWK